MTAIAPSPIDELALLRDRLGSERAVGRLLGKGQRTVWGWLRKEHKLQSHSARLIRGATEVVDRIVSERGYAPAELEHVLETPWEALGGTPPVELIKAGRADEVMAVLGKEAVPIMAWRRGVRRELDESVAARLEGNGPLHESFVFLRGLDADATMTFAGAARRKLDTVGEELEFDAFLAPYWAALATPARQVPALIDADSDDSPGEEEFNIDDLLIIDGGMASLRFLER